MFGLGTWEIVMILIAALVFIGPSKLPGLARTMGKGMRDLKRAMAGFEDEVRKVSDVAGSVMTPEPGAAPEPADDDEGATEAQAAAPGAAPPEPDAPDEAAPSVSPDLTGERVSRE